MNKEEMLAFARARLKPVTCLDQVEVLAPPSVREELKARLQKMQEKYKT